MRQDNIGAWREALLLPGEDDLVESGLRELAEYFGISREEARGRCERALADSKREWESGPRQTPEQIKDFYRSATSYVFEHVWWHATDPATNAANVEILRYAQSVGANSYLDFGAGVGANALLFARHGFSVTLADISAPMLEFACWRLRRRGIDARLIDLNRQALPDEEFDFVTAVDVCEHLPRPEVELQQIRRAMRDDGILAFNCRPGVDEDRPMHVLKSSAPVWRALRGCGFRRIGADGLNRLGFSAVRRIRQSKLRGWWHAAYDHVRFSRIFMPDEVNQNRNGRVRHPQRVFFDRVESILLPGARWLDLGCGRQLVPWWMSDQAEIENRLRSRAGLVVGVDPDFAALGNNRSCHARLQVDSARLPFADGSFDLVTSNMVFEHVESPPEILREIRRVLRPDGRLLLLTPNWLDVVTIAARVVPNRWHPAVVSRVELRRPSEVYPTHFHFNRPGVIEATLREAGFNRWSIEQLEHPDAYSHVPVVGRIETAWHRMASRWPALRGVLLIEAE